jgi:hypothetical protein
MAQGNSDDKLIEACKANLNLAGKDFDDVARNGLCADLARVANGKDNVPVSPAFSVLNVTPDTVIRPRTPNDFATSVLNSVDPNGNFQQGLAMDFNPYMLFAGDQVTLGRYQEDYTTRLLARSQLSIATTKGREDSDKSARLAIGLNVTPWLDSDPKLKDSPLLTCMGNLLSEALSNADAPPLRSASAEIKRAHQLMLAGKAAEVLEENKSPVYKNCREKHRKVEDNSSGWTLGLAPSWNSEDGDLDDLEWNGMSLWSSLALNLDASTIPGFSETPGFGSFGQGILHVRYTKDEEVANPSGNGQFLEQDSLILSGKLRFNGPEGGPDAIVQDMKFSVEGAYIDAARDNDVDDKYYQWNADLEFRLPKIADNLWLVISAGKTTSRETDDESFAGASIKWGFTDTNKKK